MTVSYNPDFNPTGIEGDVDTHGIPWLQVADSGGLEIKPLRASPESGHFSVIARMRQGTTLSDLVYLGARDLLVLTGRVRYPEGPLKSVLEPGIWGFCPANSRIQSLVAEQDTELLINFYGPVAFLHNSGNKVKRLLTANDVLALSAEAGLSLVPNTLAECMQKSSDPVAAPLADSTEGAAVSPNASARELVDDALATDFTHPHFVDTRKLPWIVNPGLPDIALKIMRVSEETGVVSLLVRHNGVAGPHYHLGAADFLVLIGRIGYRAGPSEGYGPGVWFFEPAGARHEATQRIGEEDLIYTANVYGPVQFDEGPNTPIVAVQSWMQYKELADASGVQLVSNTFPHDHSLLAWAPLGDG